MFNSLYLIPIPITNISNHTRFLMIIHNSYLYALVHSVDLPFLTLGSFIPHNCLLYVSNIPYPRVGHAGTQAYWKDASIPSCFWIPDFPILIMSANQCDTTIREHFEYSFIRIPISQSPFLGMYKPS